MDDADRLGLPDADRVRARSAGAAVRPGQALRRASAGDRPAPGLSNAARAGAAPSSAGIARGTGASASSGPPDGTGASASSGPPDGTGDATVPPSDGTVPGTGITAGRALARAGILITIAFAASRVLGYVRYVVFAAAVPDTSQLDAFFAAFRIPDFLFQLVAAGALSSAMIPVLTALIANDDERRAWRVASTVTTLMLGALLVLGAVVLLIAPGLVPIIAPGFEGEDAQLTADLTRIMVLSPMFLAAGSMATSILNAKGRFAASALAPLVYNVAIILGAILLVPPFGIAGLALGVVVGAAGHVVVQLPGLRGIGARLSPRVDLRDEQARKALVLMGPRALGLGATQLVFIVMTGLASMVGEGAITEYTFAFAILQIPIGVIGVPLGVVLLPSLSHHASIGGDEAFRRLLVRGLRLLGYVMVVIAAIGFVLSDDVTRLLFDYGATREEALEVTGAALSAFMLGLTAHALIAVLARAFYAMQDTATPVAAAIVAVVVDIVAAVILVRPFGVVGLAAAIATGAWAETILLGVLLGRRVPGLDLRGVAWLIARATVVGVAAAAVALAVRTVLVDLWTEDAGHLLVLARLVIASTAGGLVVLAGSWLLRIGELRTIVGVVVDLLRRRGRA